MSDLHQQQQQQQQHQQQQQQQQQQLRQQQHVSFVSTVKEGEHERFPSSLRNYYAYDPNNNNGSNSMNMNTVNSSSSTTSSPIDSLQLHRTRATSSASSADSYPSPELSDSIHSLYINHPTKRSIGGSNNEIIDQSHSHDTEKVVEVSPEPGRYLRLNTLLGKGAYKVVYKAIDRQEGYEVAWNAMQVFN